MSGLAIFESGEYDEIPYGEDGQGLWSTAFDFEGTHWPSQLMWLSWLQDKNGEPFAFRRPDHTLLFLDQLWSATAAVEVDGDEDDPILS